MDFLKRNLAPISGTAWDLIDDYFIDVVEERLSARKVLDVEGPHGWKYSAYPLGRVTLPEGKNGQETRYGVRKIMPLTEVRIPFSLDIWELDNADRGALDIDLDSVKNAAVQAAAFEDTAVYHGLETAGIRGMFDAAELNVSSGKDAKSFLSSVSEALAKLQEEAVEGPYSLVVSPDEWKLISEHLDGYPVRRYLERLIEGSIVYSSALKQSLLVSLRGDDMKLILGQDFSIGYDSHTTREVHLYVTETFTFHIIEPKAFVVLKTQ